MDKENHAIENAKCWMLTIVEFYHGFQALDSREKDVVEIDDELYDSVEKIRERINELPLSVQVREDWHDVGDKGEVAEFNVLLSTGGPALRIVGDLDQNNCPADPKLQWQDWGTPWTDYDSDLEDSADALQWFVEQFYYGE